MWSTSRPRRLSASSPAAHASASIAARIRHLLGLAGRTDAVETLEPRQLLSAAGPGAEVHERVGQVPWGDGSVLAIRGSYVVTFADEQSKDNAALFAQDVAQRAGLTVRSVEALSGFTARLNLEGELTRDAAREAMSAMPWIRMVAPDAVRTPQRVPNDPVYGAQWALKNTGQVVRTITGASGADIGVERAWDVTIGSRDVIVAVIDTGVDIAHPDFINAIWTNPNEIPGDGIDNDNNGRIDDINGWDFADGDNNPLDSSVNSHGTRVAGIIGANGNNGLGITGTAWNISILPIKVALTGGQGETLSSGAIIAAYDYLTTLRNRGVNVVVANASYGAVFNGQSVYAGDFITQERDAIGRFTATGALVVAAAGNSAANNDAIPFYPASHANDNIISVAATTHLDTLAGFSNFGATTVDLAAPGFGIISTARGGAVNAGNPASPPELFDVEGDGTSYSAAFVSGAVALLKSARPNASAVELRDAILTSVDPLPALQNRTRTGGRLNIGKAMDAIRLAGPIVTAVNPGQVTGQINPETGLPFSTFTVTFNRDMNLSINGQTAGVSLVGDGVDGVFGGPFSDDVVIPIASVTRNPANPRVVTISLGLGGFGGAIPVDRYRLTLSNTAFVDIAGNRLNGNQTSGSDFVQEVRVVNAGGANEQNDTLAQATNAGNYTASGSASFNALTIGDGLAIVGGVRLDVDIFRIDLVRPGFINAEVIAQRLPGGSTLDAVLRLFDATGQQLAVNDQFFGNDPSIQFFVRNAGTYYLGVSGFGNAVYDPQAQASGTPQSTGDYNFRVNVTLAENDVIGYTAAANGASGPLPLTIPVGAPTVTQGTRTVAIDVLDDRQIIDLNLRLNIQHTAVGDLEITLIGPDNTQVRLFTRRGGVGDDLGTRTGGGAPLLYTVFDDEATTAISAGSAPFAGSFRPEAGLSAFDGKRANGRWFLLIDDRFALNSGRILDWDLTFTFSTDVFGPFESNETVSAATALSASSTGAAFSATRDAFIGDGGFGNRDRDLFRFTAQQGYTFSAAVQVTSGTLDAALVLLDGNGNRFEISNPAGTRNAFISNYVFPTTGTFYLAVVETANVNFPFSTPGGGVAATTTGGYRLAVTLAPGVGDVGDGTGTLAGNSLRATVGQGGLFDAAPGLSLESIDFMRGPSTHFFGLSAAGGLGFINATDDIQQPFILSTLSDSVNLRLNSTTNLGALRIDRSLTFSRTDRFVAVDVTFSNTGGVPINNVAWMEGLNPNQGRSLGFPTDNNTDNDVDPTSRLAIASYPNNTFQNGVTVALGAAPSDPRAKATVIGTIVRDARTLVTSSSFDPDGARSNSFVALSFDVGNIPAFNTFNPNESKRTVRYFYFFGTDRNAVFNNADPNAQFTQLTNGTGQNNLAASPSAPALETLSNGATVPTLPFRAYYPEGFLGAGVNTFIPLINPNDQDARVVVIMRFEGAPAAKRDRIAADVTIAANTRAGVDINRPSSFAQGRFPNGDLIDPDVANRPYAIEVRSDRPIAASFSYYDLVQIPAGPVAVGEAFVTDTNTQWSFGSVEMRRGSPTSAADDINSFVLIYNPTDSVAKMTFRAYREGTNEVYTAPFELQPKSRGGTWLNQLSFAPGFGWARVGDPTETRSFLPEGVGGGTARYGFFIDSDTPIVAAKTTYNPADREASGVIGNLGRGSTTGVIPISEFGLRSANEVVSIVNTNNTAATIDFSFVQQNGSTDRRSLSVPANSQRGLRIQDLPGFATGQPFAVTYSSNVAVSMSVATSVRQGSVTDAFGVTSASQAATWWGFGEGIRPGDNSGHPGLSENLRIYNTSSTPTTLEIRVIFDPNSPGGGGTQVLRRTIAGRGLQQFSINDLVAEIGNRRLSTQFFGLVVQSPVPVVAAMSHFDLTFPGGFATLGTPLGRIGAV